MGSRLINILHDKALGFYYNINGDISSNLRKINVVLI